MSQLRQMYKLVVINYKASYERNIITIVLNKCNYCNLTLRVIEYTFLPFTFDYCNDVVCIKTVNTNNFNVGKLGLIFIEFPV